MFGPKEKKATLRSVVSFEALEISGNKHSVSEPEKPQYATMVIKRGKQQRYETINEKLPYVPLDTYEESEMEQNAKDYREVLEDLQWTAEGGLDATQVGNNQKRSIAQNDLRRVVDYHRCETHRIFNVARLLNDRSMTRDSHFTYKEGKNGQKTWSAKTMELKVELYGDEKAKAAHANRKRIGTKNINLSDYIGKGTVTECFRMHSDAKTENVYLTVRIQVLTQQELEMAATRSSSVVPATVGGLGTIRGTEVNTAAQSEAILEDSDDDLEIKGMNMMAQAQPKGSRQTVQNQPTPQLEDAPGDRFSLASEQVIQMQMQRLTEYADNPLKLKEEVDKLTQQVLAHQKQKEQMAEQLKQLKSENAKLVAQVTKLEAQAADDSDNESDANEEAAAENVDAITLKARLTASEKECAELRDEVAQLKEDKQTVEEEAQEMLKEKQDEIDFLQSTMAAEMPKNKSGDNEDGEESDAVNKTYIEQMETRMKDAFKRQVTVTGELKELKKQHAQVEQQHKEEIQLKEDHIAKREREIKKLKRDMIKKEKQLTAHLSFSFDL